MTTGSSQSTCIQANEARMESVYSCFERSKSVSSMRKRNAPLLCRAKSQLKIAERNPPICKCPVGDGANRTRIAPVRPDPSTLLGTEGPLACLSAEALCGGRIEGSIKLIH